MLSKTTKKVPLNLEKLLFYPVPQPLKPEPFFDIQAPQAYDFPLQKYKLEGIQLIENYFPQDINKKIQDCIKSRIQRIARYNEKLCALGRGRGFLCADTGYDISNISAFCYGPNFCVLAFEDRSIIIYSMEMKQIKQIKDFSERRITFLKILTIPKQLQGTILLLTSSGVDLTIHRIQKSFFSGLSVKFRSSILNKVVSPITHIIQIPDVLRIKHLSKETQFQDSNLICIMSVDRIWIIKILNSRINSDKFWQVVFERKVQTQCVNTANWGEAIINSVQKQIYGDRLILTYSFGCKLYLAVLQPINKYLDGQIKVKYEWVQSYPFKIENNKNIAFCQYMRKNQILLILQTNQIIIFHTEGADLFDKAINIDQIPVIRYQFQQRLKCRTIETVTKKKVQFDNVESIQDLTDDQRTMLHQVPLVTFADTFSYEYQSNQIYFLTERKFGIYVYFNWKQICDHLKVQQKYQIAMNFLIALYKKANRFELGLAKTQNNYNAEISQYSQILASEYIKTKFSSLKNIPQLLASMNIELLLSIPIEFLVTVNEFAFLFEILKEKIIQYQSQDQFYAVLQPFIYHGRIKYIPENQLREIFQYFIQKNRLDLIQRLSIYFDIQIIDRGIIIQYLLNLNLVVSLAYVCTQGNEIEFVTPFVKYWGLGQNEKRNRRMQKAQYYAVRALWYVRICLQRNMALKSYSFQKYANMINILTNNFFTKKMITGLLEISMESCLDTLGYYFSIEISGIVNTNPKFKIPNVQIKDWIRSRQGNQKIQLLLSALFDYLQELKSTKQSQQLFYLLLSRIIIYKTVKFTKSKYLEILQFLIKNYSILEKIKFGLDPDKVKNYQELLSQEQAQQILSSQYISKILVLAMQEEINKQDLKFLYQASRRSLLTQLQAHISLLQCNYKMCIQIYLRGRQSCKKRIFNFLENTLKNFTIGKVKNQMAELKIALTQYVNALISLDPKMSRHLIQTYIPQSKQYLVFALQNDESLQLEFLSEIVSDVQLSERAILRYIELMCKLNPTKLAQSFKLHTHFPVEQSIRICEEYKAYDCMQYLYERMGNVQKSVQIASYRIDNVFLQRFKNNLDPATAYSQIDKILSNAIEVCIKNHSQSIWQSLLDSALVLFNKYKSDIQYNQEIGIFYNINAKILYEMVNHSSIQYTIDLFQNKYKSLDMGGTMKKAFIQILSNFSYIQNILFSASDLNKYSYSNLLAKRLVNFLKPYHPDRICNNCDYPIIKSEKFRGFFCGHTYHKECVVETNPVYCVNCMYNADDQLNYYLSIPNPQNPKIKIEKLIEQTDRIKFQMKQKWRVIDFEESQRTDLQEIKQQEQFVKKKDRFKSFDEKNDFLEYKNQQILNQIQIKLNKLRVF